MSTPGSRERTIGLAVMLVSVTAGMHSGGGGGLGLVLLCFVGGLLDASLIAAGIRRGDSDRPAPTNLIDPVVLCGARRALAAFLRLNAATVGLVLVMASCAVTAVSGEEDPVLCFCMFALFLLGVSLINIGARGA